MMDVVEHSSTVTVPEVVEDPVNERESPSSTSELLLSKTQPHVNLIELSASTDNPETSANTRTLRQRKPGETIYTPPKRHRHATKSEKSPTSSTNTKMDTGGEVHSEKRKILPRRPGISWTVGAKLEAMDFLKKWYPARIVSIDEDEQEVLIHFDRWNSRFDEWLDMRSERLRPYTSTNEQSLHHSPTDTTSKGSIPRIQLGSLVLAKWANSNILKYPAKVKAIKSRSVIDIVFYDGVQLEVLVSTVQSLPTELQKEALHIWNLMSEIAYSIEDDKSKNLSRREAMVANKLRQDKQEIAEALLIKLVEKSGRSVQKPTVSFVPDKKSHSSKMEEESRVHEHSVNSSAGNKIKPAEHDADHDRDTMSRGLKMKGPVGRRRRQHDADVVSDVSQEPKRRRLKHADVNGKVKNTSISDRDHDQSVDSSTSDEALVRGRGRRRRHTSAPGDNQLKKDALLDSVSLPVVELEKSSHLNPKSQHHPSKVRRHSGRKSEDKPNVELSHPKHGYTMVFEPVDAKPAKAFVIEVDHNQFKCPQCSKGFRKESLLQSHVKHYHNSETVESVPSTRKRKRRTFSHCDSTDPDVITPSNTAPSTPLGSPKLLHPARRAGPSTSSCHSTEDAAYDAETDEEVGDGESSHYTEVVNCMCGFNEEDDLMIQCEQCCCWQHAECFKLNPETVPERYICFVCNDTPGVRQSCRYMYNQDWQRLGSLPKFDFLTSILSNGTKREAVVRETHKHMRTVQNSISSLSSIGRLLDSAEKGDMYELALWSAADDSDDNQEAKSLEQENLLRYVDKVQTEMEEELQQVDAKLKELEEQLGLSTFNGNEDPASSSKSLQTIIKDVNKVQRLADLAEVSEDS